MAGAAGPPEDEGCPCDNPPFANLPLKRLAGIAYATALTAVRDKDDAMDIAQEAMARMLSWVARRGAPTVPEAWISTVARNLASNHHRYNRTHPRGELSTEPISASDVNSELLGDLGLVAGFHALPERQRQVLEHLYSNDFDVATAARYLGVSEETVRTHRRRALSSLRSSRPDLGNK